MTTIELTILTILSIYLIGLGLVLELTDEDDSTALMIVMIIISPALILIRLGALIGLKK